jgi:hypothetical protein
MQGSLERKPEELYQKEKHETDSEIERMKKQQW